MSCHEICDHSCNSSQKFRCLEKFRELRPEFPGTGSDDKHYPKGKTKNQKENIYEKSKHHIQKNNSVSHSARGWLLRAFPNGVRGESASGWWLPRRQHGGGL